MFGIAGMKRSEINTVYNYTKIDIFKKIVS